MLYQTINRNSIAALIIMPLMLLGLWTNSLLALQSPGFPFELNAMPLWNFVANILKGNHLMATIISMFIALILMFGVNRITNRYSLAIGQTSAPGFIYLLFISGYLMVQKLHPVWFFTPLLLLAIERLFSAYGHRKPMTWCFEAMFWLSLGTLFYAKGIYLSILIWMTMFILRLFTLRTFLATLIGLILPYLLAFGYYFWIDKHMWFIDLLFENLISPIAFFNHTLFSQWYNGIIIAVVFVAIMAVVRIMPMVKIVSRKHYRIFIWLIVLCVVASLTPYFSLEIIPVLALGSAIICNRFISVIRRTIIQDVLFLLLIIITISAQFLI